MRRFLFLAAAAAVILAGACAKMPTDPEERAEAEAINDPLEPTNRTIHDVNTYLDVKIMEPVAQSYRDNMPDWLRHGVHNALTNLREPFVAGNRLLQGDPDAASDALGRFMVNSTFGVLGFDDNVARSGGPKFKDSDLGMTLAIWGIGEGPYLELPLLGPSNLRDGSGRIAEFWLDPMSAVAAAQGLTAASMVRGGGDVLDQRTAVLDPVAEIRRTSIDEYAAMRSLSRQHREAVINADRNGRTTLQSPAPGIDATPAQGGGSFLDYKAGAKTSP